MSLMEEVDIICLVETWLTEPPQILNLKTKDKESYWSKAKKDKARGRSSNGIGILSDKNLDLSSLSNEFYWEITKSDKLKLILIIVYISPCLNFDTFLEMLQDELWDLMRDYDDYFMVIGGDSNARLGDEEDLDENVLEETNLLYPRKSLDLTQNSRAAAMKTFMNDNGFIVINGRTLGDFPAQ